MIQNRFAKGVHCVLHKSTDSMSPYTVCCRSVSWFILCQGERLMGPCGTRTHLFIHSSSSPPYGHMAESVCPPTAQRGRLQGPTLTVTRGRLPGWTLSLSSPASYCAFPPHHASSSSDSGPSHSHAFYTPPQSQFAAPGPTSSQSPASPRTGCPSLSGSGRRRTRDAIESCGRWYQRCYQN